MSSEVPTSTSANINGSQSHPVDEQSSNHTLTRSGTSVSVLEQREHDLKEEIQQLQKETEELEKKDGIIERNIKIVHDKLEKEIERKKGTGSNHNN